MYIGERPPAPSALGVNFRQLDLLYPPKTTLLVVQVDAYGK